MSKDRGKIYPFPDDLVSPEEKAKKDKWGIHAAKAVYYNTRSNGSAFFYNNKDLYRLYIRYALGQQDEEYYHPILGINSNNIKESQLASIRWNIRNYATKRVNSAISKIMEVGYDPIVNAVDEMAVDIKKDYAARLKTYVNNKKWLDDVSSQIGFSFMPENVDINNIPTNDEEIDIHMSSNFKLRSEFEVEEGVDYHLDRNNFEILREKYLFDVFTIGVCCLLNDIDGYNNPTIDRINPQDMFVPYSEEPDFSNIRYAGHIDRMSISELKVMAGDEFSKDEYEDISENFTNTSDRENEVSDIHDYDHISDYRDERKVKVFRFEILTQDEFTHVKYKDNAGNERFPRKKFDYYRDKRGNIQHDKFKAKFKDQRELVITPYTSCYVGYWIVGSDYIFNYGLKRSEHRETGALGDSLIGYKIYAPNMYGGEPVSTIAQMKPILDSLQDYHLKLQQIVSSSVPKGIEIDLFQLSKAKFVGANKKEMTDMQKLEMYFQRGIILRNSGGKQKPGADDRPIRELENGMARDAMNFLQLIQNSLNDLDEITGVNRVISGSNLHEKTGKGVAEMQERGGVTALDYLHKADKYLFLESVKNLGVIHVQSVKYGSKEHYNRIFGNASVSFLSTDNGIDKHDFGFQIEERPTREEWAMFYQDIAKAAENGQVGIDDEVVIKRIKNLKKAQLYLRYAVNKNRRIAQQMKQQDSMMNAQVQEQSNQIAHQNAMKEEDSKKDTIRTKGDEDRRTLKLKYQLDTEQKLKLQGQKISGNLAQTEETNTSKEAMKILEIESKENNNE